MKSIVYDGMLIFFISFGFWYFYPASVLSEILSCHVLCCAESIGTAGRELSQGERDAPRRSSANPRSTIKQFEVLK